MATAVGKSTYSTNQLAQNALNQLAASLRDKNGRGMFTNDLDAYLSDQLRSDYSEVLGYGNALDKMNAQSDASWDLARAQQIEAMNRGESENYANTQNAVAQMRSALAGSAASGANRGAANATALQAMLGLGQQNAATTTEGMQAYQNTAREAAAARAANAVSALEAAREGMNSMYENATSAYGADHTYGTQGIADSIGTIASGIDTAASSERMNNATNQTNKAVAETETKSSSTNKNYNYNRK